MDQQVLSGAAPPVRAQVLGERDGVALCFRVKSGMMRSMYLLYLSETKSLRMPSPEIQFGGVVFAATASKDSDGSFLKTSMMLSRMWNWAASWSRFLFSQTASSSAGSPASNFAATSRRSAAASDRSIAMVFSFFNRWSSFLMYKERGVNVFSASARFVIALFSNAFGRDGARDFGAWRWCGSCAAAIAAAAATSASFAACKIKN
jgi:hypothetical protein